MPAYGVLRQGDSQTTVFKLWLCSFAQRLTMIRFQASRYRISSFNLHIGKATDEENASVPPPLKIRKKRMLKLEKDYRRFVNIAVEPS